MTLSILSLGLVPGWRMPLAQGGVAAPMQPATIVQPAAEQAHPVPAEAAGALRPLPPVPPPSLQTLVDERRDRLHKRWGAMFDARHGYMPPYWRSAYDEMGRRHEAMRRLYRRQRDASRFRHNGWLDAMCPWSKPRRDRSAQRNYLIQMERIDRREAWDAYPPPHASIGRPIPW